MFRFFASIRDTVSIILEILGVTSPYPKYKAPTARFIGFRKEDLLPPKKDN